MRTIQQCSFVKLKRILVLLLSISLSGCVGALIAPRLSVSEQMKPSKEAPTLRAIQTRSFDGVSESILNAAALAVLQDSGFQITSSDNQLGLIMGRKRKGADEVFAELFSDFPEVIGQIFLWELSLGFFPPPPDPATKVYKGINVALVIEPASERVAPGRHIRVIFHRYAVAPMRPEQEVIFWADAINNPKIYEEFFARLSKAITLEVQRTH